MGLAGYFGWWPPIAQQRFCNIAEKSFESSRGVSTAFFSTWMNFAVKLAYDCYWDEALFNKQN